MIERSIVHGSFTVERTYRHAPAVVFGAWAKPEFKRQWFGSPEEGNTDHIFEFRVGGREFNEGKVGDNSYTFDVRYQDIVENNRIIYTYEMKLNGERISVSVASVELRPVDNGTRMIVREDGVFLDGLDTVKQREDGTNYLIDQLGAWLDSQ
jgi:uncharacterized protein YndB with AHSA1/START domain